MTTLVYQYGLLPPIEGAALVREQLRLAHRYQCELLTFAAGRRAAERDIEQQMGCADAVAACDSARAELNAALNDVRSARQRTRTRAETAADRERVRGLRAKLREATAGLRETRRGLREALQSEMDSIHERWLWLRRSARAASGLRHGTYTAVEDAVERACSDTPLWDEGEPSDPRRPRWTGEGLVGVQIQGGATEADLRGEHTQARIGPPSRGGSSERYATLWLRVGSDDQRGPIWAVWPMKLHRPLPSGAVVKRAYVHVRRVAWQERWTCELTVELPDGYTREPCGTGAVGVDIGWRHIGGEIRVAVWRDESGQGGELRVPGSILRRLEHAESIRAIRDRALDHLKRWLCAWRRRRVDELPAWLVEATATMHQWRSWARMSSLATRWTRLSPDVWPRIWAKLDERCHNDRHLWVWEAREARRALGHRRELYRRCAAQLARTYSTIVLEEMDLRRFAERKPTEHEDAKPDDEQRLARFRASLSELRGAIETAARTRGADVVRLDAAHTTDTCWEHGAAIVSDAAEDVTVRYACGCAVDQDAHAAMALVARFRERSSGEQNTVGARVGENGNDSQDVKETRWQRVKRQRAEKEARMGTAREPKCKAS